MYIEKRIYRYIIEREHEKWLSVSVWTTPHWSDRGGPKAKERVGLSIRGWRVVDRELPMYLTTYTLFFFPTRYLIEPLCERRPRVAFACLILFFKHICIFSYTSMTYYSVFFSPQHDNMLIYRFRIYWLNPRTLGACIIIIIKWDIKHFVIDDVVFFTINVPRWGSRSCMFFILIDFVLFFL